VNSPSQRALPHRQPGPDEVQGKLSFAGAIELCAECAGYDLDKQSSACISMDKARWSRVKGGTEGIKWEQLQAFMDACGNDAPLLWMLAQRGYDLHSLRRTETENERLLRETKQALDRERAERLVVEETLRRIITGGAANA
jgi:hypothetical protein